MRNASRLFRFNSFLCVNELVSARIDEQVLYLYTCSDGLLVPKKVKSRVALSRKNEITVALVSSRGL